LCERATVVHLRVHLRLASIGFWGGVGMLSVAKLTLGQEAYYEQQVAGGLDDYYAGRGESPGLWAGSGASGLGLVGVVEDGALGTLLRGVDPASGKVLRAPVRERIITVRALDLETGEWRDELKRLAPVSGYDLVFSCPKSVSLLHALTGDERVRRAISEAHDSAWQAALGYLESEACLVRRGKGGLMREPAGGFVAAAFRHRASRAQDPHLHTHVIVANMAAADDGEWRALDGEAILRTYRLAAGYLYEAHLRHELTIRLGLEWTEPVKGMGELARVPEDARRAFSSRRRTLVEYMETRGTVGFAASRVAALATREAKEQVDLPRLREDWLARAAEHGLGRRELRRLAHEQTRLPERADLDALAERLLAPDGLAATRTTFSQPELVRAVAGSLPDGAPVADVLAAAGELSRSPCLELVEPGDLPGRPARFTTRELLVIERDALTLAIEGREVGAPVVDGRTLLRTLADSGLARQQQQLVREAALSRNRVVCVVGVAGAGKTTALSTLAEVCRPSGIEVLGAAPNGRAAEELTAAAGIPGSTLHRLLLAQAHGQELPHRCLLVIDEAGMAETRVLAPVLRLVEAAEGKAILLGDPRQLPAVGSGGLFQALCDELGAVELTENRRQHDPEERRALALLRGGNPEAYLSHAATNGHLHVDHDPITAKQRLLEEWWQAASSDPVSTVMIAHRRADVTELNRAGHALMLGAGRLGQDQLGFGEREFRAGDRVICRHNDSQLGIRNGTRATVLELDDNQLTIRTDPGALRHLPAVYVEHHLDHGYALTGHAAQGATVERAFVLIEDRGALQEWGYVACSRARSETRLYLAARPNEPDQLRTSRQLDNVPERTASALSLPAAESLAVKQVDPATARLLAARRRQLEQSCARAEQRLGDAERQLQQLGWRGRRSRGAELRTEIAFQRTALRHAREQLATRAGVEEPSTPHAGRDERTRERRLSLERQLRWDRLERVQAIEHDRGLELEL
jgi:conjugative relaxase-like TrwC/TraI family protein